MKHEVPQLPYAHDSLEPYISKKTIEYHYGKHHNAYANKLNELIIGTAYENSSLEDIILDSDGGIFNNAAQLYNHSFYFLSLKKGGANHPKGELLKLIDSTFGSFEDFKTEFSKAGATLFGSGWVWLVKNKENKISIIKEPNAGNPMTKGYTPLLTMDVWEHAYYLDTQNARPKYIENFWNIVDWDIVGGRF